MASITQPPSKRMRTSTTSRPRDPSEELSQVANLVERRRLQNRISQRNYRNKIRDRLEALEALVDKTSKKNPSATSTSATQRNDEPASSRKPHTAEFPDYRQRSVPITSPGVPTQQSYQWDDMHDFLDNTPTDFEPFGEYTDPQTLPNQDSLEDYSLDASSPNPFTSGPSMSLPSPALTSPRCNPFDTQAETAKLEDLSLNPSMGHSSSSTPAEVNHVPSTLPPPPHNSPHSSPMHTMACPSPVPYSYPFVFSAPYLPVSPMALPQMNANGSPNEKVLPVTRSPGYTTPPIPAASYFPPQQYVWVPVPVMGVSVQQPVNVPPTVEKEGETKEELKL